ncbi:Hypothetical predicted protein [Xyrichtys novacula]|uniref:Uncharacterized protein n=1 Tax=Xyrichtys novacula TaxID=13765 RepID=A0AAV1FD73_XYRNO|nr:Hypothetical predicted protein [Xyrichtys novacula]
MEPVSGVRTNTIAAGAEGAEKPGPPPLVCSNYYLRYVLHINFKSITRELNRAQSPSERGGEKELSCRLRLYVYKNSERTAHASVKPDHFVYEMRPKLLHSNTRSAELQIYCWIRTPVLASLAANL